MKIHEYQAKDVLRSFGLPVPAGELATTVEEAVAAAERLQDKGATLFVVKAQIHAGGRGKGGGVKLARTIEDVETRSREMLGMQLVTHRRTKPDRRVRPSNGC